MIKKADALVLAGDYQGAQKAFSEMATPSKKLKMIALIHQADMYMRTGQQQKLLKIINQIDPKVLEGQEKQK